MFEFGWNVVSEIIILDVKYLKVFKVFNFFWNYFFEIGVFVILFVEENFFE